MHLILKINIHEKHQGGSLNAKITGSDRNLALVKPPPDEEGKGNLQRRKAALRNGTILGGYSHFLFWEAQIFIRDAKTGMKPILRHGVRWRWIWVLQEPLKMVVFGMNLWIQQGRISRHMDHTAGVMSQLYGRRGREKEVFLRLQSLW